MKRHLIAAIAALACFIVGRVYEANVRMPEERENIMAAYRAGKSECNK